MNVSITVSCYSCKGLSTVSMSGEQVLLGYCYCPCCGAKLGIVEDVIQEP